MNLSGPLSYPLTGPISYPIAPGQGVGVTPVAGIGMAADFLGTQISNVAAGGLPNIGFLRVCSGGGQAVGWQDIDGDGNPANYNAAAIARLDAYADLCRDRGILLDYVFDRTPVYCATGGDTHNISTSATPLNTFLDWLVDRVGDVLGSIEPWNEPNTPGSFTGTEANLITHAGRIYDWVQSNVPGILVTTPSYTDGVGVDDMQSYLEAGGNDVCDVFSYHAYMGGADDIPLSYNPEAAADYADLRELICPEKPLWMSECGDSSPTLAKVVSMITSLVRMGHDKAVVYSWQDNGIGNMRLDTAIGTAQWNAMYAGLQGTDASPVAPTNLRTPVDVSDGELGDVIHTTRGVWSASRPLSFGYQRKRNGVDIGGATTQDYTIVGDDVTKTITAAVTATNAVDDTTATSAGIVVAGFWPAGADHFLGFPLGQYMTDGDVVSQPVVTTRAGSVTVKDSGNNDVGFGANVPAITDVGLYTTANDILRDPLAVGSAGIGGRIQADVKALVDGQRLFEISDGTTANRMWLQVSGGGTQWVLGCSMGGTTDFKFVASASTGVVDIAFALGLNFVRARKIGAAYGDVAITSMPFPSTLSRIGLGGSGNTTTENGNQITKKLAILRATMNQTVLTTIEGWVV